MENGNMIRKNSKNLIGWVYENVIDFTAENDTSGLTWDSTPEEAKRFLSSIPIKERVQKYGVHASRLHYYLVDDFNDIAEGVKKGYISEQTCKLLWSWSRLAGRENWNMDDIEAILYD